MAGAANDQRIGRDGQPIRALAFAGGGYDTAMQLGITHALLVSRARPPDIVVGSSVGAVNAVALAEVLQAGDIARQIARFREIYETYLDAPATIRRAYRPDTFQVDSQRPLESVELPIHHTLERDARKAAVASRAGLINFFNTLLRLDLDVGTLTRAIRRGLGLKAASTISAWASKRLVQSGEIFRSLMLAGQNLHHLAVLVWPVVRAVYRRGLREERGATAAELIFRSTLWRRLTQGTGYAVSLLVLVTVWLLAAAFVLGLTWVLGWPLTFVARLVIAGPLPATAWILAPLAIGAALSGALFVSLAHPAHSRALLATLWSYLTFGLLAAGWGAFLTMVLVAAEMLWLSWLRIQEGSGWGPGDLLSPAALGIAASVAAVILLLGLVTLGLLYRRRRVFGRQFLTQYGLNASILDPYPLRQLLISVFDPEYYGKLDMTRVVETSLQNARGTQNGARSEKLLDDYGRRGKPPIQVGVTVADLATGGFEILPGNWRVVDGLEAALAAVPLFPPVPADQKGPVDGGSGRRTANPSSSPSLLIDSLNIANEPTRALFSFMRHSGRVNQNSSGLLLYSAAPLPFARPALGPDPSGRREYNSLVDVSLRAWELRRFRDATLERRMTELHTKAMPPGGSVFFQAGDKSLVRSWVFPIEPEAPLRANERVMQSESPDVTRRIIAETVADGCQAALEVMMQNAIRQTAVPPVARQLPYQDGALAPELAVPCRMALANRLAPDEVDLPGALDRSTLPESAPEAENPGPGLTEVCKHCALYRHHRRPPDPQAHPKPCDRPEYPRMLRVPRAHARRIPEWPRSDQPESPWREPKGWWEAAMDSAEVANIQGNWSGSWPLSRNGVAGTQRPTVSLLFSGGVFKGVFQVGALNALSEASLIPDVVAGASVGTITAAMASRMFLEGAGQAPEAARRTRAGHLLPIAAVYLAIDRLVLTDRFADFIRGITVRAAESRFSIRDLDRVFRRYDDAGAGQFSREFRRVVAGIERLTYMSPFELKDLLEALRRQEFGKATRLMREDSQEWLERVGVGNEILGTEPLEQLIHEYVLKGLPCVTGMRPEDVPFSAFSEQGLFFLATTTNLTRGCLEIVGENQLETRACKARLLDTLLTSSAFPAVFRPRWAWEFMPTTSDDHQFIDGGVIDNLPLDAVAQFLLRSAQAGLISPCPGDVPHLLFAASLEPAPAPPDEGEIDQLRQYWPQVLRHARRLRYNGKLEVFARAQRNLRQIVAERERHGMGFKDGEWKPLDLEVVPVIPRWLCSTFGFHPMLGFRRDKQARSIAHGCAATLLKLGAVRATSEGARWSQAWGMEEKRLPSVEQSTAADPFVPLVAPSSQNGGVCWYRPGCLCPFSEEGQTEIGATTCGTTRQELIKIHRACGQSGTHENGER